MTKTALARLLLETKAVFLSPDQPFTWASGIQSPIYCDNRRVLAFPEQRRQVKDALVAQIQSLDYDAIMGTATAGIPMASILADHLNKPLGYVRSSQKKHGRSQQIEGYQIPNTKVVLIEDLISTGGSVLEAVHILRQADIEVVGVVAIFTYQLKRAEKAFAAANVPLYTLSDRETLLRLAVEEGYLAQSDLSQVQHFFQELDKPSIDTS
ncbi:MULTISPECIES: orotate phosphoribosyltransferase [unclassified Streptococcus]|uniref:orotate phosphoribosyltransferase n=1 Tax=unclassified Streptococcus TaxID=2608887 RepID=UPI00359DE6FE